MRTVHVITLCLGLLLIVFSSAEVAKVRQYRTVVRNVQTATEQKVRVLHQDLRRQGVNVTMVTPIGVDLSELDAVASLERDWWIVFGAGAAISAAGTACLVCARPRHHAANHVLEATAG